MLSGAETVSTMSFSFISTLRSSSSTECKDKTVDGDDVADSSMNISEASAKSSDAMSSSSITFTSSASSIITVGVTLSKGSMKRSFDGDGDVGGFDVAVRILLVVGELRLDDELLGDELVELTADTACDGTLECDEPAPAVDLVDVEAEDVVEAGKIER